jgi:hypothetical protein
LFFDRAVPVHRDSAAWATLSCQFGTPVQPKSNTRPKGLRAGGSKLLSAETNLLRKVRPLSAEEMRLKFRLPLPLQARKSFPSKEAKAGRSGLVSASVTVFNPVTFGPERLIEATFNCRLPTPFQAMNRPRYCENKAPEHLCWPRWKCTYFRTSFHCRRKRPRSGYRYRHHANQCKVTVDGG